jgi:hypothetical protein
MSNTWPGGNRHAMSQSDHAKWNNENYPGTLEICCKCDEPTGNCEEDNTLDDDGDPYCYDCAKGAGLIESDAGN